jgi:hypothetical protein
MKNLKTYRMFESVMELTQEQVQWLDNCAKGSWSLNPQTGLVDVTGDFNCSGLDLTDFKGVKFGEVWRGFYCENNRLTSLVGAPQEVGGRFYCDHNALTSLEGAPQRVDGDFCCNRNNLTSLVGAPQEVGGGFYCDHNALTSLEGAPQEVKGNFNCYDNDLTSLIGAPQSVGGHFYCDNNPVSRETLKTIFTKMQKGTSYLAAVESIWSELTQDDQAMLYADDFKWVSPEQGRGLVALRAYQDLRGML